jgi:DNA-directed RNA polymerase specialized sigma24 family protein
LAAVWLWLPLKPPALMLAGEVLMSSDGSVTHWIGQLKAGEQAAAQPLWEAYFRRLVGLARKKLAGARYPTDDPEDVALSAFDSFCRGAEHGRFPQLADREDLWRLLVTITARKVIDLRNREHALKRGGVPGEAALPGSPAAAVDVDLEQVVGTEPTPAFAAEVADECRRLLDRLGDEELRALAVLKMEGHTNVEIAGLRGCALATVERRLRLIRDTWQKEGAR